MRQVLAAEYDQILLLPPVMDDWIDEDHPARFVREFVRALDLRQLQLDTINREEGGVTYEPALLLSAWLYGYMRRIRSTRALERACREEMGLVWLTGNHRPDHNALWRFWNAHREKVGGLYRQTVRVAVDMKLVGFVVQALDGTKIQAAATGRGSYNRAHLQKLLAELDEEISRQEQQIEAAGAEPEPSAQARLSKASLREQVRAALARVEGGETRHVQPTEPEASRMECDGRNRFGYNAQAMVDTKAQIIVANEVTNAVSDHQQLNSMITQAQALREELGIEAAPTTLADGGYATNVQLGAAADAGHEVVVALPGSAKDVSNPYHAAHFRHDPQRQVVVCPEGRELPLQRVRMRDGRRVEVYRSAAVCRDCPVRAHCTKDRHGRTIDIAPGHAALVTMRERWREGSTTELYGLRAATVEPVFAQIKEQMGFRRWTVRGLTNVRAQWSWLCAAKNLKTIYRHWRDGRADRAEPNVQPPPNSPRPCGTRPAGRSALGAAWVELSSHLPPLLPSHHPTSGNFAAAA